MNKSKPYTYWVFCDESGDLSTKNNRHLIAVAVGTRNPDALKKAIFRVRKMHRIPKGKTFHATDLDAKVVLGLLQLITQIEDLKISIGILDKQWIWNQQISSDHMYDQLFGYVIQQTISVSNDESTKPLVILERRKKYKSELISEIHRATGLNTTQIQLCTKNDRQWGQQLSVADSIAWSTYQKYEKGDVEFFHVIQNKIWLEKILGIDGVGMIKPISEMNNSNIED